MIGKNEARSFQSLLDRTWKRISNWKSKYLSNAGKETLIKSVLQVIPSYSMSIFLLLQSIISKLNSLISKFWWGFNRDQSKIHWIDWGKMGVSKSQGVSFSDALTALTLLSFLNSVGKSFKSQLL